MRVSHTFWYLAVWFAITTVDEFTAKSEPNGVRCRRPSISIGQSCALPHLSLTVMPQRKILFVVSKTLEIIQNDRYKAPNKSKVSQIECKSKMVFLEAALALG
jgi:hypothetical protein